MTCEEFQAIQLDTWQGHGSPKSEKEVADHLANCPSCREESSSIPSVLSLLCKAPDHHEPSPELWSRIEKQVGAPTVSNTTNPGRSWAMFKMAAAVLAAAALFYALKATTQEKERVVPQTASVVRDLLAAPEAGRAVGESLPVGGTMRLAEGEAALLDLPSAGRVELRGPATCVFDSPLSWTLDQGELTADITPGGKGFHLRTPCAEITVTGTAFRVNAASTGTELTVARGIVRMSNALGSQAVGEKSLSMARPGVAPSAPRPVTDAVDTVALGDKLPRDPLLSIEKANDSTLRFHLSSPHARLVLQPPAASPNPYYLLNCLDAEGNSFTVKLNDLGGNGNAPIAVEGMGEMVQEFKVGPVLPHPGVYMVTGVYVGSRSTAGAKEWQGIVESAPILIEAK